MTSILELAADHEISVRAAARILRPNRPRGYAEVKTLAKDIGEPVKNLLILAPQNDPFYAGSPADVDRALWFHEQVWQRFGYERGVHLRRVHYQALSSGVLDRNGKPYENTERCWSELVAAAADARQVGLVSPEAMVDRKNAGVVVYAGEPRFFDPEPAWEWTGGNFALPELRLEMADRPQLWIGDGEVEGYEYDQVDQPVLVEVWVEKSTMNDVLDPVCRRLGVNLQVSSGFQSITNAVALLTRCQRYNKPARIFYLSDFDPAGDQMAVAVARQVEFWVDNYAPGIDIKITPLFGQDVVERYDLPRVPIKDEDRRKASFEARRGTGAVELDALEALYPGELADLVSQSVMPYRDVTLWERFEETQRQAVAATNAAWRSATASHRAELDDIAEDVGEVLNAFRPRLEALADEIRRALVAHRERVERVQAEVYAAADEFVPPLPDRPTGSFDPPDEDDWLFDASRAYLDQIDAYRAFKAGGLA